MEAGFWELFVQHVTTSPHQHVSDELNGLAEKIAGLLAGLDTRTAAGVLSALNERIAQQYNEHQRGANKASNGTGRSTQPGNADPRQHTDPSDVDAPPDAPKPVPVPPEVLAEANRTFNEAEIAEAIRDIRAGRGRKFEDFIDELDALPSESDDAPQP